MIAYIFPGQGSQSVGMGKDLYDSFPEAKDIFDRADKALGFSLSDICFNGPQEKLTATDNAQPAILTTSIAVLEVLKTKIDSDSLKPAFVAGLSLGEYSALVAGGVLSFESAVCLVRSRGMYMQEAAINNPGKMLSIIGLARDVVGEICKETGCEIANLNCPGQVVVSGKNEGIDKAALLAKEKGAKRALPLAVSGAFHSSLMKEAQVRLADQINKTEFTTASIPIVSNVTATSETVISKIKDNLIKQVSSSTYWEDSIKLMAAAGVDKFLEIGPGVVLKGLSRRIDPSLTTVSIGRVQDINTFMSEQIVAT